MNVESQSQVTLRRGRFAFNHSGGVVVFNSGTDVTLEDVSVTDTQPQAGNMFFGRGIDISDGAVVFVTRGVIERNHSTGVLVSTGSNLALTDVSIVDTMPEPLSMQFGRGLGVQGAQVVYERGLVHRSHEAGIFVALEQSELVLADVSVTDTQPTANKMSGGRGLDVTRGARIDWTRGVLSGNHEVGMLIKGLGTTADLREIVVSDTRAAPCDARGACEGFLGSAIMVESGAEMTLSVFDLTSNSLAGLQFLSPGQIRASDGVVHANIIGVNIQNSDLNVADAFENVLTFDNQRNRDFSDLPVPESAEVLGAINEQ